MANLNKSVPENVTGEFFVDLTCIDCDTCRQIAPKFFGEAAEHAYVKRQPESESERISALHAIVSCPTGSIGSSVPRAAQAVMHDFPIQIEEPVYYCGFNSPKSFGGNSYFLRHAAGNWLIDSPKFLPQLVRQFAEFGGIANIFLTHRDDVADADRYARRFSSRRIIHRDELHAQPDSELVLNGSQPFDLSDGFIAIPIPGHTRGHMALLYDDRFLFTGDHLDWDRHANQLDASKDYCWYSWREQITSMEKLTGYRFEWVLPGHGQRVKLPRERMQAELKSLIERMKSAKP